MGVKLRVREHLTRTCRYWNKVVSCLLNLFQTTSYKGKADLHQAGQSRLNRVTSVESRFPQRPCTGITGISRKLPAVARPAIPSCPYLLPNKHCAFLFSYVALPF